MNNGYMDSLREKQRETGPKKNYRSRSFRQYFEGYVTYQEQDANGRMRIRRVYRGTYYTQNLSRTRAVLLRVLYVALFAAIAALFIAGAAQPMACNSCWYVVIGQSFSMVSLLILMAALFNYLIAPRRMTISIWRAAVRNIRRASLLTAAAATFLALVTLLYLALQRADAVKHLLLAGQYLLCAGIAATIFLIERRIPYEITQSEDPAPEYAEAI